MDNQDLVISLQEKNRILVEEVAKLKVENTLLSESLKKYEPKPIKNEIEPIKNEIEPINNEIEPRTRWGEGERGWGKY